MTDRYNILLVDDDRDIRESLTIILEKAGYSVRTAANGAEALKELEAARPDLMILDVMMKTQTEGFDLAYALADRNEFESMPVILLTSFMDKVRDEGPDQFQHILGENWPAKWIFEKPVKTEKLLAKIKGILGG